MRKIIALLIGFCFIAAFYAEADIRTVNVYTFKKERVDQNLSGNRGYLAGKPGNLPEGTRTAKRTLFGVDIEIPAKFWPATSSEKTHFRKSDEPREKDTARMTASTAPQKVSGEPAKAGAARTVVADDSEQEWIK
jgi:hypothetical protein